MIRVLVIDDHPGFGQELARLLRLGGYEVVATAGDIVEAEQLLRDTPVDLAVVDVVLPGINGIDGIPRLRAIVPHLPAILVSAHRDGAHQFRAAAFEAGNAMFVAKDNLDVVQARSWTKFVKQYSSHKGD